jgi:hypothetical protein
MNRPNKSLYTHRLMYVPHNWYGVMDYVMILDSSVGIATGYGLDGLGSIPGRGKRFLHSVQTGSGPHPASYPMGTDGLSSRW